MAHTSLSHPLQIAAVRPWTGAGRIGVTFCPGKTQAEALTGAWERDLALDLDAVREWGAKAVLTLLEDHEIVTLGVRSLSAEVRARGLMWFHAPIADYGTPDAAFEASWRDIGQALRTLLADDADIVIHCKG